MRDLCTCFTCALLVCCNYWSLAAAEVRFDFEGFGSARTELRDQIPGVRVVGEAYVLDPVPAYAAWSGTAAAGITEAYLQFIPPVMRVRGGISPASREVRPEIAAYRADVDVIAYDARQNERARVRLLMPVFASTPEELATFRPERFEIAAPVPIAFLAFRYLSSFYLDDLSYAQASPQQLQAPLPPAVPWPVGSFEDATPPGAFWGASLAEAVPGVEFLSGSESWLADPAPEHAITSGYAAARIHNGTSVRFAAPVSKVTGNVAPYDPIVGTWRMRVDFVGYDAELHERARSTVYLDGSTNRPVPITLESEVPLNYLSMRNTGHSFWCDDLTFTPATRPQSPVPPPARWAPGSFEGLLRPWETYIVLSNQIAGVHFDEPEAETYVTDLPTIEGSAFYLSPLTSGSAAAHSGAKMRFDKPVVRVSAYVSWLQARVDNQSQSVPIEMVGYNDRWRELARASVDVKVLTATVDELLAIVPQKLEIASTLPMRYVHISGGAFDDLSFTHPEYLLSATSLAASDGFVAEGSEHGNLGGFAYSMNAGPAALRAGDTGLKQQLKAILSFKSTALPEGAEIVSAKLRLKRGVTYGNPFGELGQCRVEFNAPAGFGGSIALEAADFQALPTKMGAGTLLQENGESDWFVANLDAKCFKWIKNKGRIQFRLCFDRDDNNDLAPDYIGWFSGENANPANRPVLDIIYR